VDEFDFGITRATSAIAETGTIVLQDKKTPDRLGALAPWTHIAVVEASDLIPSVVQAIQALPQDPNVIWVTGPSKTADVEGILIEGVHGPGIQACLLM
jgi:L-lactate dehydrogenase complex protein LldG